jgi:hypothetical protein
MVVETLLAIVCLLATGIEAAYVPADEGGGDYLVRVEPDLVRNASPYTFTSDVPADSRDVRRVKIYVADSWPPAVERAVLDAAKRPRTAPVAATRMAVAETSAVQTDKPWPLLIGSLIALFLSLGANAYLGMLLGNMRARYLRDIQQGIAEA